MSKFCMFYTSSAHNLDKADEIIFEKNDILKAVNYPNAIPILYLVRIGDMIDIDTVNALHNHNINSFKVICKRINFPIVRFCKENNIPVIFDDHCNTYDMLQDCVSGGADEVYVTDFLGFDIVDVSDYCHESGVKVRVYPDVAQSYKGDIGSFFIRPEDIDQYESFIDTFEFYYTPNQSVKYEIYAEQKKWDGKLGELIGHLNNETREIENNCIARNFSPFRMRCRGRCAINLCHICYKFSDLSKTIADKGWKIDQE